MDEKRLHELLHTLHVELENTPSVDDEARAQLQTLKSDIESLLAREGAHEKNSLLARLDANIQQFEVSHPALTVALAQVMDTLSRLGI